MRLQRARPRAKIRQFFQPHIYFQSAAAHRHARNLPPPSRIGVVSQEPQRGARIGIADHHRRVNRLTAFSRTPLPGIIRATGTPLAIAAPAFAAASARKNDTMPMPPCT